MSFFKKKTEIVLRNEDRINKKTREFRDEFGQIRVSKWYFAQILRNFFEKRNVISLVPLDQGITLDVQMDLNIIPGLLWEV